MSWSTIRREEQQRKAANQERCNEARHKPD
jgi:hypothetical protein